MRRHKRTGRILLAIGLLLFIAVLAGIVVLRSPAFHRYVLGKIIEEASQATGGKVAIGDFHFRWSGLTVDLYSIVLHGTEAAPRPPLLQVDHLRVGFKILSLWRSKINLREIIIDHPTLNVTSSARGVTNLPHPPPSPPGTHSENVFDLAIGHVVIDRGDLDYNDRRIPLTAEVHDLGAEIGFDSANTEYDGSLGYRDGRIEFGTFNPIPHSIQLKFGATPSELTVNPLVLDAGASTVSLQARLQDYSNPTVDGSYQADLSTGELGRIMKTTAFPVGRINLRGTVHYLNSAGRPLLDNLTLAGQFRSPALALDTPQVRATVRAVTADYSLSSGTLEARNVRADVFAGKVSGNLVLTHLTGHPAARLAATVRNVSIEALGNAVGASQVKRARIAGRLNATVEGSWEGSGQNLELRSDASIAAAAPVRPGAGPAANVIPLEGALHLVYDGRSRVISLENTEFSTPHTTLRLNGSTGKQSNLSIQARSDDLREVDHLALIARHAGAGGRRSAPAPVTPLGISGSAAFDGQLRGSLPDLHLTGQLSSAGFEYQGVTLSELRVNVALSPSGVSLRQGEVQTGGQGRLQFNIDAGLRNWSYTPSSPVRVDLTAAQIPAAAVEQLANLHYPVTGTLGAHISMRGSQSDLVGQGTATLASGSVWNQPIQNLSVQFHGAGSSISSSLQVQAPAGSGSGKLTYDFRTQAYDAQFSVPSLHLGKLEAVSHGKVPVTGVVAASLEGRGTLKDPQLTASIQSPKLVIGQETLSGFKLGANVAQQKANLTLDTTALGAPIQARANIDLDANYDATASVDIPSLELGPVLAAFLPQTPAGLHGRAELHGSLHGPLKQRNQIEAEVDIPTLNLAYQSLQVGNASPIRATYSGGIISLERCSLKGTGTDVEVQATVPLEAGRNLQATATGNVDLHLIQLLYPTWESSGQVQLDVTGQGTLARPDIHGTGRLVNAVLQPPGAPLGAQNLNAVFALQNGRIDIQSLTGEAGGGKISATGFATFQPSLQFNMKVSLKEVRVRYPAGTRTVLGGTLLLAGTPDSALLNGQVLIDSLSLTRDFDLSTFADQLTESYASAPTTGFLQNVRLNVYVNSTSEMAVANSQLSFQGSAHLLVRGTVADPVILGRTDITEGEIFFNGDRFQIESGVIQFVNPVETEPLVNLHVTTVINQFNITMNIEGPIDRLHTSYTSDPPVAPLDIINLLATGQTTQSGNASPTTPESVLAGQLASQFSGRLQKLAGISSLTIDPQIGTGQGNGTARVAIQQRVTKDLFFSFTTDLTNSTDEIVEVQYQVTPRFAVSTMRDQNGIYTVQIKMRKHF